MPTYKHFFLAMLTTKTWVLQVFLVVLFTFISYRLLRRLYTHFQPKARHSNNLWDDILLESLYKPLCLIVWVVGLSFAISIVQQIDLSMVIFKANAPLRDLAVIITMVWFLLRFIVKAQARFLTNKHSKLDKTTINALSQILRVSIIITGVLIALQNMGYSISGLLALGGAGTIIIGLAAKDMLANFFGGLMVYLDRPFAIGDWIRASQQNIEGTVEHIGWRLTRIRTFDKRPIYVPNGMFSNIAVENPSRMTNRRIYTKIGLRYEDAAKMAAILAAIEAMLRNHSAIDTTQTLMVNLVEFGDSGLIFMIYAFTKTTQWVEFQAIQQEVFLNTLAIISKHGAQCAFPTTTVYTPDGIKIFK